jgi:hypothetical protein
MTTRITFDFDASAFGALRLAPKEFAREMRIAATVQWDDTEANSAICWLR